MISLSNTTAQTVAVGQSITFDTVLLKSKNGAECHRKHYTETHSSSDKSSMDGKAREHIDSVILSIREIWNSADPTLRQQMKSQLTSLVNEMS